MAAAAAPSDYESVLCVKPELKVYRIPPRQSARAVRAADWKLESPDWVGRLRIVATGRQLSLRLEDRDSGQLFARCPVDSFPGVAIEPVADSSRYFVIRVQDDSGRNAFIGIGFDDRSDAFDFNVAVQDHFKWLRQEAEAEQATKEMESGPKLDLSLKEGQTIKISLNTKKDGGDQAGGRPRAKAAAAQGAGFLPPPPAPGSRHGQMRQSQPTTMVGAPPAAAAAAAAAANNPFAANSFAGDASAAGGQPAAAWDTFQ